MDSIRTFDAGASVHKKKTSSNNSAFLFPTINIRSGNPCELAEIILFNGYKHVPLGRMSTCSVGLAAPNLSQLFDNDLSTLAAFPKGKPLFGYYSRLLDQLIVWDECILEYRNGGKHAQLNLIVLGSTQGAILPGWSDLQFSSCINGTMNYQSDIWDYACWTDFFDPTHFEIYDHTANGKSVKVAAFRYSKTAGYAEDLQHGSTESALLKELYHSGLYSEIFKKEYYTAFCNTIKYVIIKGFDSQGNVEYMATFGNPSEEKHGGVIRFPPVHVDFCKDDPAIYSKLEKQFMPKADDWRSYAEAVLWRLNK